MFSALNSSGHCECQPRRIIGQNVTYALSRSITNILTHSASNHARLRLIDALVGHPSRADDTLPDKWFDIQRAKVLSTLKKPDFDDIQPLALSIWTYFETPFLRET